MGKTETITIVTLLENDPITGVKYGEQKITVGEISRQKHINRYICSKSRRQQMINKNCTRKR